MESNLDKKQYGSISLRIDDLYEDSFLVDPCEG